MRPGHVGGARCTAVRARAAAVRLLLLAAAALLGGCAQFPAAGTGGGQARQLLDMRLTVRGSIDPNAYYLFVIDTDGRDSDGPEVIAPFTEFLGNGRATGSYAFYVEYHLGLFELFRDQPEQDGTIVPPRQALGEPFFTDSTSSAGTLQCSVDLATLRDNANDPNPTQLEVNFITVNEIVCPRDPDCAAVQRRVRPARHPLRRVARREWPDHREQRDRDGRRGVREPATPAGV